MTPRINKLLGPAKAAWELREVNPSTMTLLEAFELLPEFPRKIA